MNARPYPEYNWCYGARDSVYIFDASSSTDYEDEKKLNYRWDFNGDGSWDTDWISSAMVNHKYAEPTFCNVILEIRDTDSLTNMIEKEILSGLSTMAIIPGGEFLMGTDDDLYSDVKPSHSVYLDAFKLDRCEVTNGQYATFLNELYKLNKIQVYSYRIQYDKYDLIILNGYQMITFAEDSFQVLNEMERYPVEQVTWYGANMYAEHFEKRLPTEAEWEKANRGTDYRLFPWGE